MPLGFERINARRRQPNERINFIKPLEGPEKAFAEDFLERIAAICNPIMKADRLAVMSLEQYECNREFLGRNFNGGEVIQLVLKAPSGHWLPFRFVQMVMMHELAHCKQMNHSGAFWKVKNHYSAELKSLWSKGYTGEGLWSRGRTLLTGQYENEGMVSDEVLPEHLCGGTFKSSGKRKRPSKPRPSYKEQKERRILKKFGSNGMPLGADQDVKTELENGKKAAGKPRVASSNRGRELRAAAALARFGAEKEEAKDNDSAKTETDLESDSDWEGSLDAAVDINGEKIFDSKGRPMVRICADEEDNDAHVKDEMSELSDFKVKQEEDSESIDTKHHQGAKPKAPEPPGAVQSSNQQTGKRAISIDSQSDDERRPEPQPVPKALECPVCSVENDPDAPTCMVCANVLKPAKMSRTWRCQSEVCRGGKYINAGDYGRCGICGGNAPSHA